MEFNNLVEKFKEEFPDKAIDISEGIELLRETIKDSIDAIGNRINKAITNREDFENLSVYYDMAKDAYGIEKKIQEIMNMLEVEEIEVSEETEEEIKKKTIPNYVDYIVDNNIEHTLYENFTHKRPFGFKFNENHVVEVSTWKDMLVKTCKILMVIDKNKFMSFESNDAMNGKKKKYFSANPNLMTKPRKIADNIYIETNQSGNAIRNLMVKLLKEYDFRINDYKVYFRADYTNLNNR